MQDAAAAAAVAAAGMQKITCRGWEDSALLPTAVGLCLIILFCVIPSSKAPPPRPILPPPSSHADAPLSFIESPATMARHLSSVSTSRAAVRKSSSRCSARSGHRPISLVLPSHFFLLFSAQIMLQSGCNVNIEDTPRFRHMKISTPGYLSHLEDQRVTLHPFHNRHLSITFKQ